MRTNINRLKQVMFSLFFILFAFKMLGIDKPLILVDNNNIIHNLIFQDHDKQMTIEEKLKKYEGAFQIQLKNIRLKPSIPYNIDELIEKNRKENETVYISLGSQARLKILSINEVKSNGIKKPVMISTYN